MGMGCGRDTDNDQQQSSLCIRQGIVITITLTKTINIHTYHIYKLYGTTLYCTLIRNMTFAVLITYKLQLAILVELH